ncbi:MAG: hypothetical protein WBF17_04305, partial [Phycisphaerae bacterium]
MASHAKGVSDDGSIVVGLGYTGPPSGGEAFALKDGNMVGLGDLPGGTFSSCANGISDDGAVIVGYGRNASDEWEAVRWDSGVISPLGFLAGGINRTVAHDASADGSVIVGYGYSGSGQEAAMWDSGGIHGLGDLPGGSYSSTAYAVSADGSIIVGTGQSDPRYEAFRWESNVMTPLGDLPGGIFGSTASDISADGTTIVGSGYSASGREATRWAAGGIYGLGDLPGGSYLSTANAVSGDGSVIVGISESAAGFEVFVWDATNGMRSLVDVLTGLGLGPALAGWTLEEVTDISNDGLTIVGDGTNPTGDTEGWIATLPGPPAARMWTGAVDDDWFNGGNWSPAGGPAPYDALTVTLGAPHMPQTTTDVEVSDGGRIALYGLGASCTFDRLDVGGTGSGELSLNAGTSVSSAYGVLGMGAGSAGTATVSGAAAIWTSDTLVIGYEGTGTLNVENGGTVFSNGNVALGYTPSGVGVVTVEDANWSIEGTLYIGHTAAGTVNVGAGAQVTCAPGSVTYIGLEAPGGSGSATVDNATWTADEIHVGFQGTGTLDILNGGVLTSQGGHVATEWTGQGTVTVAGSGSLWDTSGGALMVGEKGTGTLNVRNRAAVVTDATTLVGDRLGAVGTVNVEDANLVLGGSLYVGNHGTGTLNVLSGGRVAFAATAPLKAVYVGEFQSASGTITVDDGVLETDGLAVGHSGAGTLDVRNGGTALCGSCTIGTDDDCNGTVTVDGGGSTWTCSGRLTVGLMHAAGTLNITGGGSVSSGATIVGDSQYATGDVTVDGNGSTWTTTSYLHVGGSGIGTLSIRNGGGVSSTEGVLGDGPGSDGVVTVDGNGSTWTTGDLYVGISGTGTLTITNQGVVRCNAGCVLGHQVPGQGVVDIAGDGSLLEVRGGGLIVGYESEGLLTIRDGAEVNGEGGTIGLASTGVGTVSVEGAGWICDWLAVGGPLTANGGTGVLDIWPGGEVSVGGVLRIWPDGTVNIYGGTLRFAEADPLDPCGGTLGFHCGTVEFDRDLAITADNVTLGELFGSPITIPAAKTLSVTGTAALATQVTLDGGTFSVADLANAALLQFDR